MTIFGATMKQPNRSILGVTLLEIMLVLAIAAMIIVMSIRYYQSASSNQQANMLFQQLGAVHATINNITMPVGSYTTATTAAVQTAMGGQSSALTTPFGTAITLTPAATSVAIQIATVPTTICSLLTPKLAAIPTVSNISACNGGNMTYTYSMN
jgi:hypothetical protein